jgi:hypothetical protein
LLYKALTRYNCKWPGYNNKDQFCRNSEAEFGEKIIMPITRFNMPGNKALKKKKQEQQNAIPVLPAASRLFF